jgi:hypothetical protein
MNRAHALLLAFAIGLAAVSGTYAALKTTELGAQATPVSDRQVAAAETRLDRQAAQLRRAARQRPPKLPELPAKVTPPAPAAPAGPAAAVHAIAPAPSDESFSAPAGWEDDDDAEEHEDHGEDDDSGDEREEDDD